MVEREFRFRPPDRASLWKNLNLTMSQAAALTGASERQIQHWMDRGYITPAVHGTRKINGESLDAILLIRQARAAGIPLGRAVRMAREYAVAEVANPWGQPIAPVVLYEVRDKLQSVRAGIDAIEDVIGHAELSGTSADETPSLVPGIRHRV